MSLNIVSARPFASNTEYKKSFRVIGSLDVEGKGTEHDIPNVDPFVFLDETELSGEEPWPFPAHPHAGLFAMTYLFEGRVTPWDNHKGWSDKDNRAGGLYWINSGQGIVHEEKPQFDGRRLRWLQLWLNPGVDQARRPMASSGLVAVEEMPVLDTENHRFQLIAGRNDDLSGAVITKWPFWLGIVTIRPQRSMSFEYCSASRRGFGYVLGGIGTANDQAIAQRDLVRETTAKPVVFTNTSTTEPLVVFLAAGRPHGVIPVKLLGHGGAFIESTVTAAREALVRYESNPDKFGIST